MEVGLCLCDGLTQPWLGMKLYQTMRIFFLAFLDKSMQIVPIMQ